MHRIGLRTNKPGNGWSRTINSRRDVYALAWTVAGSIGYVSYDLNNSYFDGFNRLHFDGFGGMDNNSFTIGLVTGVGFCFFLGLADVFIQIMRVFVELK